MYLYNRHVRYNLVLLYNVKHISDLKLGLNVTASFSCEVNHSVIIFFLAYYELLCEHMRLKSLLDLFPGWFTPPKEDG